VTRRITEYGARITITHHAFTLRILFDLRPPPWLLLVELSSTGGYRSHLKPRLRKAQAGRLLAPRQQTLHELSIPEPSRRLLPPSTRQNAGMEHEGARWQLIFLHLEPGKNRLAPSLRVTRRMFASPQRADWSPRNSIWLEAGGLRLPFRVMRLPRPAAGLRL